MNGWKLAFWICFVLLIGVTLFGLYSIIDQGVTITYQREGYTDTEEDLDELIQIINETDLSKKQIISHFDKADSIKFVLIENDSIFLNRIILTFDNDKLGTIGKQW